MKKNILVITAVIFSGGFSHAGFECQEQNGAITVETEHEDQIFEFEDIAGKITILTAEQDKIQMSTQVSKWNTRVGGRYTYKLPVEGVSFSVSEFTALTTNPGCVPGGRITCDYDWFSSFEATLILNGNSYGLDCKVL